jgi:hypothetical protein
MFDGGGRSHVQYCSQSQIWKSLPSFQHPLLCQKYAVPLAKAEILCSLLNPPIDVLIAQK